jgi:Ca2+-binding RTX toxin-like protein
MPVTLSVALASVDESLLGGPQVNAKVGTFADGSFVVAWQEATALGNLIRFRTFNADGSAKSAVTDAGLAGTLQDLAVTEGNAFALVSSFGTVVGFGSFRADTLQSLGVATVAAGGTTSGVQLVPRGGPLLDFVVTTTALNVSAGVINIDGTIVTPRTGVATATGGALETVVGSGGGATLTLAGGTLVSSDGSTLDVSSLAPTDIVRVSDGFYVLSSLTAGSNQIRLTGLFGAGADLSAYSLSSTVTGSAIPGSIGGTAQTDRHEVIDLGNGRVLSVFASFRGNPTSGTFANSGIHAQVFDMAAGQSEGGALLLQNAFGLTELQAMQFQASVMADGRVAVAITRPNGLTGLDVFRTILDPRETGVTVAATTGADMYVGSAFDDTFTGVGAGDSIFGGTGNDTVVIAGGGPVTLDLANPLAFAAAPFTLVSVENVTTSTGFDVILGNEVANILNGNGGTDALAGRGGNDSLIGGSGNDTLDGGAGTDTLEGGSDSDLMTGGVGADLLLAGSGDDTLSGGSDNDTLQGGDGNDVLTGGQGDDLIFGGVGNDIIDARFGADTIFGGSGGETIIVDQNSGALIDGGSGTDTLNYGRIDSTAAGPGIYVDLAGITDALATRLGYEADDIAITAIETVRGARGADFLAGTAGGNVLFGNDGNDFLLGRGGSDTLIGGDGADRFVFENAAGGNDRIRDFTVGEDRIALLLDGFGDIDAGNIATRFVASASATAAANGNAQILFDNSGGGAGRLLFDADGNGAGAAVLFATLVFTQPTGLATFGAADFEFL